MQRGHEVCTARTGRDGIDAALQFRPAVLVADWLLKNHLHGLHVVQVLRLAMPGLQSIVITGFPSKDLEEETAAAGVFRLLHKPFDLSALVDAVEQAATATSPGSLRPRLATVETDAQGTVVATNERALELVTGRGLHVSAEHTRFEDLLEPESARRLVHSRREWISVHPATSMGSAWMARTRDLDGNRLVLLLEEDESEFIHDPRVQLLLGTRPPRGVVWPFDDRVLVVDDKGALRRVVVEALERAGCVCYKAETPDVALRIVGADEHIGVAIVDFHMPGVDVAALVQSLLAIRPDLKIVGNSVEDHRLDFERMGVARFLSKPWEMQDLIDILR